MRPRITILAIIVTFMVGAQALADSKEKEARLHFQQGVELYQADDYEGASIEFRRAYEQNPSYRILYNIGQAENELRHYAAALVAYKQYLAEGGNEIDKGRRKEVVKELERLATLVGTIEVACLTPDALVIVDSEEKGHTPLAGPVFVDVGRHVVEVTAGGDQLIKRVVTIAGGQHFKLDVDVQTGTEPETVPTEKPTEMDNKRIWTWVAFGVGGAAGIAGGVIGGVSLARKNDFMEECEDGGCPTSKASERDTVKNMSLTADILYGVAAAGVIAGVVLYFVEPKMGNESEIAVAPTATADSVGLAVGGRF